MTLATLTAYVLLALHAWAPSSNHAYIEPPLTQARYVAIAEDIAAVALDPSEPTLFAGDDGRARTAVLLAAVASFESGGLRGDVARCLASGDHGQAWGLFQSHRSKSRVCSSVRESVRVALEQIRESFAACERNEPDVWLAGYASGSCDRGWLQARHRWNRAAEWIRTHPFEGAGRP